MARNILLFVYIVFMAITGWHNWHLRRVNENLRIVIAWNSEEISACWRGEEWKHPLEVSRTACPLCPVDAYYEAIDQIKARTDSADGP